METMRKPASVMSFQDEPGQVFNAMMTALFLLREGAKVTLYFGSRGVNAIHRAKVGKLQAHDLPTPPAMQGAAMNQGLAPRRAHAGEIRAPHGAPHTPIQVTTTFKFPSAGAILAEMLAAIEGAEVSLA